MGLAEKLLIAKFGGAEEGTTDDVLEGLEENKMLLQTVVNLLREKDQEFLAHFIKVTQYFTLNPELLIAASNNIKKGKIQENKVQNYQNTTSFDKSKNQWCDREFYCGYRCLK